MSSVSCEYINLHGNRCPFIKYKQLETCARHKNSKSAVKCLISHCPKYTKSMLQICSKCVSDESSAKFVLTKSYDVEKKNKIIEIKNCLARYAMVHTNPGYSTAVLHDLFDKINEFDQVYGFALSGDDITDYSDGETMVSQAMSEFRFDSGTDIDTDGESGRFD